MQVHLWREPQGDMANVEIPTSDDIHKAQFNMNDLDKSTQDSPVILTMPDVSGDTQYQKPLGEMPLAVQEQYTRDAAEAPPPEEPSEPPAEITPGDPNAPGAVPAGQGDPVKPYDPEESKSGAPYPVSESFSADQEPEAEKGSKKKK